MRVWVERVLKAINDVHDLVESLAVLWYDSCRSHKGLSAEYRPAFVGSPQSKHVPLWKDIITVDSVIVKFPSLKRSRALPIRV